MTSTKKILQALGHATNVSEHFTRHVLPELMASVDLFRLEASETSPINSEGLQLKHGNPKLNGAPRRLGGNTVNIVGARDGDPTATQLYVYSQEANGITSQNESMADIFSHTTPRSDLFPLPACKKRPSDNDEDGIYQSPRP